MSRLFCCVTNATFIIFMEAIYDDMEGEYHTIALHLGKGEKHLELVEIWRSKIDRRSH